jgi:phosphate starvation-inducible PhoH-like protein
MLHFTHNTIDNNVIERVILSDGQQVERMGDHDKILVHG